MFEKQERAEHREFWTFTFSKEEMVYGVKDKIIHHTERLEHWTSSMAAAEEDLRQNGIDFRDATKPMRLMAASAISNNPATAYYQQPVMHQEKVQTLQEAQWKVEEHRGKLKEYDSWARAVAHGPAEYILGYHDIAYFGL